jgi:hypothetical protein
MHQQIAQAIDDHSANTKVIFVLPPWMDHYHPTGASTSATLLTRDDYIMALHAWYKDQATRRSWNWVDLRAEFYRRCAPWTACFRDHVHWSTSAIGDNPTGNDVATELIAACLEQDAAFTNKSCTNL